MGVVNTTYTFSGTDTITSSKLNNIIDDTTFTGDAIQGTTLQVVSPGKLAVSAGGITSNELASSAVTTNALADGAVTQAKASNMLVPAGAIMPFAMNSVPTGWLAADGTAVSRSTYATLFAAIATTYGVGDGSTTFNIPDLRGYFVRGTGTNSDGTASGTFAAKQADELKSHTHTMYIHPATASGSNTNAARFGDVGLGASTTQATGGTETRPKNIAMFYCIKI
jgi:microcystin-dependent protein